MFFRNASIKHKKRRGANAATGYGNFWLWKFNEWKATGKKDADFGGLTTTVRDVEAHIHLYGYDTIFP
jgi:hypothetical protein